MKFSKFSRFSRPLKQFFPYNYNVKTRCNEPPYQPFRYLSCSNAELQNILLRSMVTGSTHASQCVTQPIYATVTKNYYARVFDCVTETYHLIFKTFPSIFQISLRFPWVFQSCKHAVVQWITSTALFIQAVVVGAEEQIITTAMLMLARWHSVKLDWF